MTGSFFTTTDLIKQSVNEYLNEHQEVIQEIIKNELEDIKERIGERLEYIQIEQAGDRKRLSDIEILLGLEESLKDENNEFYADYRERHDKLFLESVFSNMALGSKNKNIKELLYEELKKVSSMRNKDILYFLGWEKSNTTKITRLMHEMAKNYNDVVCEKVPGKRNTLRLYRKLS